MARPPTFCSKLRKLMILIALFAFVPSALLLTVGVLIFGARPATRDFVFGVFLTLGLTVTLVVGVAATVLDVRRETSVAQQTRSSTRSRTIIAPR